jgi:DNA-binding response OmpR family regulator
MDDATSLAGKRVVVIEDDQVTKLNFETALAAAGAIIISAFDQKLDAAVLDVRLAPGITSIPIAIALSLRRVPFLFCTAYAKDVTEPLQRRWPDCIVLSKPVSTDEVVSAVRALLQHAPKAIPGNGKERRPAEAGRVT